MVWTEIISLAQGRYMIQNKVWKATDSEQHLPNIKYGGVRVR